MQGGCQRKLPPPASSQRRRRRRRRRPSPPAAPRARPARPFACIPALEGARPAAGPRAGGPGASRADSARPGPAPVPRSAAAAAAPAAPPGGRAGVPSLAVAALAPARLGPWRRAGRRGRRAALGSPVRRGPVAASRVTRTGTVLDGFSIVGPAQAASSWSSMTCELARPLRPRASSASAAASTTRGRGAPGSCFAVVRRRARRPAGAAAGRAGIGRTWLGTAPRCRTDLVERDPRGHRDVERADVAEERDRHQVVAVLAHQPADAAALAAQHERHRPLVVHRVPALRARGVEADHPDPARLQRLERLHDVADARHLHVLERARGGAAHRLGEPGAVPLGQQHAVGARRLRACAGSRPGCAGPRRRRAPRAAPGRAPRASSSPGSIAGLAETTAMSPWCGTPPAMRSSVSRASKRSGTPSWLARAMASETRRLRSPFTTSSRSKCRVPAPSASSTGLMPQMRFMPSVRHRAAARQAASGALEQRHGLGGDALARGRARPGRRVLLALTETASGATRQRRGRAPRASRVEVRRQARAPGRSRSRPRSRSRSRARARCARPRSRNIEAARALPARVAAREVAAHVARGGRAQQRVAHGVEQAVAVGVALQAALVGHAHAAEHERPARHQPVRVEAAGRRGARSRPQPRRAARPRPRPGPPAS